MHFLSNRPRKHSEAAQNGQQPVSDPPPGYTASEPSTITTVAGPSTSSAPPAGLIQSSQAPKAESYPSEPPSLASPPAFQTRFACVSLNMTDRMRFIRFPDADIPRLQQVVARNWARGIQDRRVYGESHEVQLVGNPWGGARTWSSGKVNARRLMAGVFGGLEDMGWVVKAAVDISGKELDKDSLLFRLQVPPPPPSTFLSISFVSTDRMFILDAPAPFVTSLLQTYSFRVQRSQTLAPGELEIKFHGTPWLASGKETVTARLLVVMLLEVLELHGFSLYASIDQDNGREGRGMDTWYCCRRVGWEVGDPVWHA